jgi:radical SAM protein with 4Fe4S-binding SPASM domain
LIIGNILEISRGGQIHPLLLSDRVDAINSPDKFNIALTYKCNNRCYYCYAACPKQTDELSLTEWEDVIDGLNVPAINFTGGEPTLYKDLPKIIKYANSRGIHTGLITNGRLLEYDYCVELKNAGLQTVQVTLNGMQNEHELMSGVKGSWGETISGIKASLASGLYTSVNTTLMRNNYLNIVDMIQFIYSFGVKHLSFNSLITTGKGRLYQKDNELRLNYNEIEGALKNIIFITRSYENMTMQWLCPTCYKRLNPVKLGLGDKGCSACNSSMTIEPDGQVIPCQSWVHEKCGNILNDKWEKIWNTGLDLKKAVKYVKGICNRCEYFNTCNGACPLDKSWCEDELKSDVSLEDVNV